MTNRLLSAFSDRRVGIRAALIGGACAVLASIIIVVGTLIVRLATNGTLALVSLDVIWRDPFPILDVKLLNTSAAPTFIHRLDLDVIDVVLTPERLGTSPNVKSSHVYHMLLDPIDKGVVSCPVAFEVKPRSSDRFQIVVGTTGRVITLDSLLKLKLDPQVRPRLEKLYRSSGGGDIFLIKEVHAKCVLTIRYNASAVLVSEPFDLQIIVDPHFHPEGDAPMFEDESIIELLQYMGGANIPEYLEMVGHLRDQRARNLFLSNLDSRNTVVSTAAAVGLMQLGDSLGLRKLLYTAGDSCANLEDRILAVRALISSGFSEPWFYMQCLTDANSALALEALRVVGRLRIRESVPILIKLLKCPEELARAYFDVYATGWNMPAGLLLVREARMNFETEEIVSSLGYIGDPRSVNAILDVLQDERTYRELSYQLLTACVDALGRIGDPAAINPLVDLASKVNQLEGIHEPVAESCRKALDAIHNRSSSRRLLGEYYSDPRDTPQQLIFRRERDEFPLILFRRCQKDHNITKPDTTTRKWFRIDGDRDLFDSTNTLLRSECSAAYHNHPKWTLGSRSNFDEWKKVSFEEVKPSIARARALLPWAKRMFQNTHPGEFSFYVTALLGDSSGTVESAYLKVLEWKDSIVTGIIATVLVEQHSYVAGKHHTLPEREIVDWTLVYPNGLELGNFVGKFVESVPSH